MKVAIYARYSSDNQRDASIADQLRICREFAARQGWTVVQEFTDHAISGATLLRSRFQALMRDALNRRFDVVLAESLDRFSRDQEDTAGLFKRLTFAGVNIVTLAEGDITHLHIGFKGTMNALFLKDLADKTHRGLRGRVEGGKSAGGLCYGYRVVKSLSGGTVTTGEREIEPAETAIVERIYREFVGGVAPKAIARRLNRDGISGPFGGSWNPSTIHGNSKRGTGILNNELYIGRLIWNRLRYVKNPDTGKRISRLNPKAEWITKEIPSLRIVSDELWNAAKDRQSATRRTITRAGNIGFARRPQYLFSGLSKCGVCGAGFIMAGRNRLACFGAREKGTCDNHLTIRRDEVEARVLRALEEKLLNQELFEEFCDEFTREMNRLRMEHRASLSAGEREMERIELRRKKGDLRHLREQGLIETVRVPGSREHAVALTKEGRSLLEHHRDRDEGHRQTFWDGIRRERELEHDLQVYRAYEREAERLADRGARIERVLLDHELKREYQSWLHERDRDRPDYDGHPDRSDDEIRDWALEHDLPYFDDEVHFPDLRIEYQEADGRWDHDDIEVTTEHYRGAHAASVARSGFSCYGGSSLRIGARSGGGRGSGGRHGGLAEEFWR